MRRIVGVLVLAWFFALGSGAVEFAHNAQHAREDAALASLESPTRRHKSHPASPVHDDSNCRFHATLHAPLTAAQAAAIVVSIETVIDRVPTLAPRVGSIALPNRI